MFFYIIVNCVLAVLYVCCISYCESHKVHFVENPMLTDKYKMEHFIETSEQYRTLVAEYHRLHQEWPEFSGDGFAKFVVACLILNSFYEVAAPISESNPLMFFVAIALPIALLLFGLWFFAKKQRDYREYCQRGNGQITLWWAIKESQKYSYIEHEQRVERASNDLDATISFLEYRISEIKRLRFLGHDYAVDWLTFSTIFAVVRLVYFPIGLR